MYTNFVGYFPSFANYFPSMTGYLAGLFGVHHAVQIPNSTHTPPLEQDDNQVFLGMPDFISNGFTSQQQMVDARRFAGTSPTENGGWEYLDADGWSSVVRQNHPTRSE